MIRENYLLMFTLTLLVFAGQASAQSVSLRHIPGAGRTEGVVLGQGTEIVVEVSQTGITQSVNAIQVTFDFDQSLLTLQAPSGWLQPSADTVTLLSITPVPVPASARFTFTTKVDVTGREFFISLKQIVLDVVTITPSAVVTFNNSVYPPLHLDTQIESPAQNNNVLELTEKQAGDTLQFQLFVPDAAGHQFNAFQIELALPNKTASDYISNASSGWVSSVSGANLILTLLSINAVSVPDNGYVDQIDLEVTGALTENDTLRVTRASLAIARETQLDVSNAALSFTPAASVCPGDFDDNGTVGIPDFLLFVDVFGTSSGDATFNALMDMDGNGVVGIPDFLAFVDVFGSTCETTSPPPPPPPPPPLVFDKAFAAPMRSEMVVVDGIQVEAAENEILVFLDEDVSSEEVRDTRAEIMAQGGQVKSLNFDLRTIQVGIRDDIVEQDFINELSRQSGVSGANVNEVVTPDQSFITSNEQGYQQRRTKLVDTQLLLVPPPSPVAFAGDFWINQIDAINAWNALSDPDVSLVPNKIGIVDTGVPSSQDVLNSSRINRYTEEGVALSGDDSSDPHGYNVTGYAAGYGNGPDRRGVNPHSDVVFVDVLDPTGNVYNTTLMLGIKTAIDNGAGVVNISWGDGSRCSHSSIDRLRSRQRWRLNKTGVVHYARQRDVLLVWSAGNNCEKQDDRLLPLRNGAIDVANTDSWLSHTLIVGASTDSQMDACFSRMGGVVNIMAPGVSVGFGGRTGDGTSYAAPMVTGAAGLIRAIESTISAEETRSILINSAKNTIIFDTTCGEPVASSPAGLLNLGSAIQSSLVADGVELNIASDVHLARGQMTSVPINVTVPAGGVNAIDVGFVIDQSGSYEDDIQTLQNRATEIVNNLRSRTNVDVQFGLAGFADYPVAPYGRAGDVPYRLYQSITDDTAALIAAINRLNSPLMHGEDLPESQYEALFRAAREIGWREGALRILLLATDADFHDSDTKSGYPGTGRTAALATLATENVIVIGLRSGDSRAAAQRLQELADATGGSVLSLDAASSQIVDAIVRGIDAALATVDITLDVLAGQSWVTGITPTVHRDVRPGATVSFTVSLQGQRDPSVEDLPYHVYLWARGDGSALLSRTKIPIIVPKQ